MSSHHDLKEEKCWSCDYFCGYRQKQSAPFVGEYIDSSDIGPCRNPNSVNNKRKVNQNYFCNQYRKWVVVQDLLDKQKKRQEEKHIKKEQEEEQKPNEVEESYKDAPLFSSVHFHELTQQQEIYIGQCEDKIKLYKKVSLVTLILSPIIFFFIFFIVTWFSLTTGIYTLMVMGIIYAIELPLVLIVCIARVKYLRYRIRNTR